jgi:hypothetical protein
VTSATATTSTAPLAELPLTGLAVRMIILSAVSTLSLGVVILHVSRGQKQGDRVR